MEVDNSKSRRGFAAMDPSKLRDIASKGGKAAHAPDRARRCHVFSSAEAREAGRKGGLARAAQVAARNHSNETVTKDPDSGDVLASNQETNQ